MTVDVARWKDPRERFAMLVELLYGQLGRIEDPDRRAVVLGRVTEAEVRRALRLRCGEFVSEWLDDPSVRRRLAETLVDRSPVPAGEAEVIEVAVADAADRMTPDQVSWLVAGAAADLLRLVWAVEMKL